MKSLRERLEKLIYCVGDRETALTELDKTIAGFEKDLNGWKKGKERGRKENLWEYVIQCNHYIQVYEAVLKSLSNPKLTKRERVVSVLKEIDAEEAKT